MFRNDYENEQKAKKEQTSGRMIYLQRHSVFASKEIIWSLNKLDFSGH